MSVHRDVELSCDGVPTYGCERRAVHSRTGELARAEAREQGWLVNAPGGKDYCPDHRPVRPRREPRPPVRRDSMSLAVAEALAKLGGAHTIAEVVEELTAMGRQVDSDAVQRALCNSLRSSQSRPSVYRTARGRYSALTPAESEGVKP